MTLKGTQSRKAYSARLPEGLNLTRKGRFPTVIRLRVARDVSTQSKETKR